MLFITFIALLIGLNYLVYYLFVHNLNGEKNMNIWIWSAIWLIRVFVTLVGYVLFFKIFGKPSPELIRVCWKETSTIIVCWMAGNAVWQVFKNLKRAIEMPRKREEAKAFLASRK